jgi:hypothetical protein
MLSKKAGFRTYDAKLGFYRDWCGFKKKCHVRVRFNMDYCSNILDNMKRIVKVINRNINSKFTFFKLNAVSKSNAFSKSSSNKNLLNTKKTVVNFCLLLSKNGAFNFN